MTTDAESNWWYVEKKYELRYAYKETRRLNISSSLCMISRRPAFNVQQCLSEQVLGNDESEVEASDGVGLE
eukprot:CAMPEP_0196192508 /NCGR_PEP_ID=MMETSP0911-20130528/49055_1 /TAXON_ID=49265 /ORGANISM="Thalassiosira rotula, Strain GSO102" /LENGTH=70 /DNA_ID=CAMNT_0041464701 /DNA_START=895 /DNA_END=1107 /DNA_ORIENTATION=+